MKLNQNSLSAKLYRWFYGTNAMPSNLCPYFWKLVTAVIFGLPVAIFTAPHMIIYNGYESRPSFGERIGISAVSWFLLGGIICMLSLFGLFFVTPIKDSVYLHMIGIGIIFWMFAIVIGVVQLWKFLAEKWKNRNIKYDKDGYRIWEPVKEKTDNVIVEMVKAKYNKYCPKIDWK
jgi:hypothetical protein